MIKKCLIIMAIFIGNHSQALAQESNNILTPINNLFDSMREHNADKLIEQFTEQALLQRATKKNQIKTTPIKDFAKIIGQSKNYLDEQLFNITIHHSGNLASVWTPFAFYVDGKLSHCGVNSFQLINTNQGWKIQYLIDNGYEGDCGRFIKQHKSMERT